MSSSQEQLENAIITPVAIACRRLDHPHGELNRSIEKNVAADGVVTRLLMVQSGAPYVGRTEKLPTLPTIE